MKKPQGSDVVFRYRIGQIYNILGLLVQQIWVALVIYKIATDGGVLTAADLVSCIAFAFIALWCDFLVWRLLRACVVVGVTTVRVQGPIRTVVIARDDVVDVRFSTQWLRPGLVLVLITANNAKVYTSLLPPRHGANNPLNIPIIQIRDAIRSELGLA